MVIKVPISHALNSPWVASASTIREPPRAQRRAVRSVLVSAGSSLSSLSGRGRACLKAIQPHAAECDSPGDCEQWAPFFCPLRANERKVLMAHLCSPNHPIIYSKWKTQKELEVSLPANTTLTPQLYSWEKGEGSAPTAEHSFWLEIFWFKFIWEKKQYLL